MKMKLLNKLNEFTPLDIVLLIVFVIYIILPIQTPSSVAILINSPLGMLSIFEITLALFLYTNPILAVVYIFVAYELLRRSQNAFNGIIPNIIISKGNQNNISKGNQNNISKNQDELKPIEKLDDFTMYNNFETENFATNVANEEKPSTLEEEVIRIMAPIGHSDPSVYMSTSYKPISQPVGSASMF
jgi:hypothetical protein